MRRNLFWLNDDQWSGIEPYLPTDVRGKERVDDRRVISGILHVLKSGCRWCDCPPEYGPPTTIYNRFVRWAERGVWERLFRELAARGRSGDTQMIDATHVKAHRSASGAKRGSTSRRLPPRGGRNTKIHAIADAKGRLLCILLTGGQAHDCPPAKRRSAAPSQPRSFSAIEPMTAPICATGWVSAAPKLSCPTIQSQQPFSFDRKSYKQRHRIRRTRSAVSRTSGASLPATTGSPETSLASVCLVAAIVWWTL